MTYKDIPKLTQKATYMINVEWHDLIERLDKYKKDYDLDMNPEFQRCHVWNENQQIAYVEFVMKGGQSASDILFNCSGWNFGTEGQMVLVDGKQRLEAVLQFLKNEIKVFGCYWKDFTFNYAPNLMFNFYVNDLDSYDKVLQWYIDFNSGGIAHTEEEIEKVRSILRKL